MPTARCFMCGATFGSPKNLNEHLKHVHDKDNVPTKKCDLCDYVGNVIPKEIRNDTTDNILYKILKVEQSGERLHQKWNMFDQIRFFAVKNGCDKLFYTYLEYENNLYMEK